MGGAIITCVCNPEREQGRILAAVKCLDIIADKQPMAHRLYRNYGSRPPTIFRCDRTSKDLGVLVERRSTSLPAVSSRPALASPYSTRKWRSPWYSNVAHTPKYGCPGAHHRLPTGRARFSSAYNRLLLSACVIGCEERGVKNCE